MGGRNPKLTIALRPGKLDGVAWLVAEAPVSVLVGFGEHAGMLRITPGGPHILRRVALAKPVGSLLSVVLPLPAWLPKVARSAAAVEHDYQDDWIEVTLPQAWRAAPPAAPVAATPAGAMARGVQLAAEAAEIARRKAGR